jgi:hypothetical protein
VFTFSRASAEPKTQSGRVRISEIAKRSDALRKKLPADAIALLDTGFSAARVVDLCKGHLTQEARDEWGLTLLERTGGQGEDETPEFNVVRVVLSADGKATKLSWTEGPEFMYSGRAERDEGGSELFFGEMKCLAPKALPKFLKGFTSEFKKREQAESSSMSRLDSVCFSVDANYNNWECFAASADASAFVRWGYSVNAD